MGNIHDVLAGMVGDDGASTLPEGASDSILGAYDADMTVPAAAIAQRDEQIAALSAELLATKAANWDLLQAVPSPEDPGSGADSDPDNSENNTDNDDPDAADFDGMFGTKED